MSSSWTRTAGRKSHFGDSECSAPSSALGSSTATAPSTTLWRPGACTSTQTDGWSGSARAPWKTGTVPTAGVASRRCFQLTEQISVTAVQFVPSSSTSFCAPKRSVHAGASGASSACSSGRAWRAKVSSTVRACIGCSPPMVPRLVRCEDPRPRGAPSSWSTRVTCGLGMPCIGADGADPARSGGQDFPTSTC